MAQRTVGRAAMTLAETLLTEELHGTDGYRVEPVYRVPVTPSYFGGTVQEIGETELLEVSSPGRDTLTGVLTTTIFHVAEILDIDRCTSIPTTGNLEGFPGDTVVEPGWVGDIIARAAEATTEDLGREDAALNGYDE